MRGLSLFIFLSVSVIIYLLAFVLLLSNYNADLNILISIWFFMSSCVIYAAHRLYDDWWDLRVKDRVFIIVFNFFVGYAVLVESLVLALIPLGVYFLYSMLKSIITGKHTDEYDKKKSLKFSLIKRYAPPRYFIFIPFLIFLIYSAYIYSPDSKQWITNKLSSSMHDNIEDFTSAEVEGNISRIIMLFKDRKVEDIAEIINYPLYRGVAIPDVNNEKEFKERFYEIFDEKIINKISKSKVKDWEGIGYKGFLFDNGNVWLNYNATKIIQVNYQSDVELKMSEEIIKLDKENLHSSVNNYIRNIYSIRTEGFRIRIDAVESGYRYSAWSAGKKLSSKPNLILYNGTHEYYGSGGNSSFIFKNGDYEYNVYRNIIGKRNVDIILTVKKNGEVILQQDGELLKLLDASFTDH